MELVIYLLTGLSVGALSLTLFNRSNAKDEAIQDAVVALDVAPPLKRTLDQVPSLALQIHKKLPLPQQAQNHPWMQIRRHIDSLLLRGGNPGQLTCDNVVDLLAYCSSFACILLAIYANAQGWPEVIFGIVGFVLGLLLPYSVLNLKATQRQSAIRKELPYLLDLLTLCVESGMDFTTALMRIGPTFRGTPLGEEVALLMTEMRMGKSRQESLRDMSRRVGLMELSTVVNSIVQADKLGASMGPALRIQSEDMRKKRILLAEEEGMKAPVKLLFPLIIFIFPTTFMVLFGPMVIKMLL
jgi:tight adherence protein C